MQFIVVKCFPMAISHKTTKTLYNYMMRQSTLERVQNYPYLGVTISDDLSWTNHVNKVKSRANRTLCMLRRNLWSCKNLSRRLLTKAWFVRSLNMHVQSGTPSYKRHLRTRDGTRKSCAFVCKNYRREDGVVTGLLSKLKWPTLQERRAQSRLALSLLCTKLCTRCLLSISTMISVLRPAALAVSQSNQVFSHVHKHFNQEILL